MVQIGTKFKVADNSGARLAKCIKLLSHKKISTVGSIILIGCLW